jgi:hypothetical protein
LISDINVMFTFLFEFPLKFGLDLIRGGKMVANVSQTIYFDVFIKGKRQKVECFRNVALNHNYNNSIDSFSLKTVIINNQ